MAGPGVFLMSWRAALLWWRFHLVIIVYHQPARSDESCPGKISQMMMDGEDWWGGGATDHPNLVIWLSNCINFWIQSSPMCPATVLPPPSWWYFHEYWNHFHNSTQNIPGTIKKIFIVYGPDSGWCCISSFHLLFKSLLNIPRGLSTARISLH